MHSETEKQISKMSPFLASKVLESHIGKQFKAKTMFTGDLLVEVETKQQCDTFLALSEIPDHKVSVTPHQSLKSLRGVISEVDLVECSEEDILENLADDGVVAVK